ncbi:MAG: hypothetical protein WAV16_03340 [Candidatus Moraniibacteriota bacterium]
MGMILTTTDEEIRNYIKSLVTSFGIRENISSETLEKLRMLHKNCQPSACIGEIKSFLNLNLTLKIGYLNSKPDNEKMAKLINENNPYPGSLLQPQDIYLENSAAFVIRSSHLPLYGTSYFDNFKILIFIFKWFANGPFESFVYGIAHELTHIVLDATRHPLNDNEVAVDLGTMVFGFSDIIKIGRKFEEKSHGYLNDHQFEIAYEEIKKYKK